MSLRELDRHIKEKNEKKMEMKQELLRRKHENDIDLEKKIRNEINSRTLKILLEKAKNNPNEEVKKLYYRLSALNQNQDYEFEDED